MHFVCRREVYHIQRELLRERTRCKALEEELENPMNIHRWRKLEVTCAAAVFVRIAATTSPISMNLRNSSTSIGVEAL